MATDDLLRRRREEMLRIAAGHGARNVRRFGSVAPRGRRAERPRSPGRDGAGRSLSDLGGLRYELERHLDSGRTAFEQDEPLQGSSVRNLQIIGEAVRALPGDVRVLAPDIDWPKSIGMGNVRMHGYFDIACHSCTGAAPTGAVRAGRGIIAP